MIWHLVLQEQKTQNLQCNRNLSLSNNEEQDGICLVHKAQNTQSAWRRHLVNGLKTHRRVSDVNVTVQMMLNIRAAVPGVMEYLV